MAIKIKINGRDCSFFNEGQITLNLDSIASTFAFKARFNPENDDHKELFKPLQYHKCEIFNTDGKLLITGTILNHSFESNSVVNLITISGYSISGILEDVTIPPSQYPLQSNNRSLKDIAQKLCGFYGIGLVIDKSIENLANAVFKKTTASPTDTVKDYIAKLTSQKDIILSHNEKGQVVLFKPNDKMKPNYFFNKDNSLSMSSTFNGQGLHSEINVVRQPSGENSGVSTVDKITNPLIGKNRPTTKVLSSGEDTDTKKAADNELASELKAISVKVKLFGLFDKIKPAEIVNIHNHEIYSFAYTRYMVSSVTLNFNEKEDTTDLDLVLPETYTGNVPKNILFFYKSHKTHN
jgi:prophage tail gpP-like protein